MSHDIVAELKEPRLRRAGNQRGQVQQRKARLIRMRLRHCTNQPTIADAERAHRDAARRDQ